MILNFALNYGSRPEIIAAVKHLVLDVQSGHLTIEEINQEIFSQYLLSKTFPDPDLMIRTSGEIRLSNFMLWQLAYIELLFTEVYWPDFNEQHLREAIDQCSRGTFWSTHQIFKTKWVKRLTFNLSHIRPYLTI